MSDLISVIIPVYNSDNSLGRCLASISGQTYQNLEIILVDDGSTDKSLDICHSFAENDGRAIVLHQENSGPSAARNAGIKIAKGRYLSFVDSDDEVDSRYFETLLGIIEDNDSDISSVSYQIVKSGKQPLTADRNADVEHFDSESAISHLLYQNKLDSSQCCKLYKREIIGDTLFPTNIRVYEDLLFVYKIFCKCRKISWSNRKLYFYHKEQNGQMDSISPVVTDAFEVMDEIKGDILQRNPQLEGAIGNRTISVSFNIVKLLARSNRHNEEVESICWRNIQELRTRNFFDPKVRMKNKLGIIISLFGQSFTRFIFSINK